MSIRPTLAVVVPAWNAARFLPALFDALDAQAEPFDETIVVDDGSSDETASLAAARGATVLRHPRNLGCSAAKNTGLAAVRSDWVHFQDADDLPLARFARAAREAIIDQPALDAWLPRWRHVDAASGDLLATSALDPASIAADPVAACLRQTINNVGAYRVARVRAVGGFSGDPRLLHNEDRAFHLALAASGARFGVGDEVLLETRRTGASMSQSAAVRCLEAHAAVTLDHLARHPGRHAEACAQALWQAATGLAAHGRLSLADALVLHAAALGHPVDPQASPRFAALCRLGPRFALRAREYAIRAFKPWLRRA